MNKYLTSTSYQVELQLEPTVEMLEQVLSYLYLPTVLIGRLSGKTPNVCWKIPLPLGTTGYMPVNFLNVNCNMVNHFEWYCEYTLFSPNENTGTSEALRVILRLRETKTRRSGKYLKILLGTWRQVPTI